MAAVRWPPAPDAVHLTHNTTWARPTGVQHVDKSSSIRWRWVDHILYQYTHLNILEIDAPNAHDGHAALAAVAGCQ
jgi:hypothetical protein